MSTWPYEADILHAVLSNPRDMIHSWVPVAGQRVQENGYKQ